MAGPPRDKCSPGLLEAPWRPPGGTSEAPLSEQYRRIVRTCFCAPSRLIYVHLFSPPYLPVITQVLPGFTQVLSTRPILQRCVLGALGVRLCRSIRPHPGPQNPPKKTKHETKTVSGRVGSTRSVRTKAAVAPRAPSEGNRRDEKVGGVRNHLFRSLPPPSPPPPPPPCRTRLAASTSVSLRLGPEPHPLILHKYTPNTDYNTFITHPCSPGREEQRRVWDESTDSSNQ